MEVTRTCDAEATLVPPLHLDPEMRCVIGVGKMFSFY